MVCYPCNQHLLRNSVPTATKHYAHFHAFSALGYRGAGVGFLPKRNEDLVSLEQTAVPPIDHGTATHSPGTQTVDYAHDFARTLFAVDDGLSSSW